MVDTVQRAEFLKGVKKQTEVKKMMINVNKRKEIIPLKLKRFEGGSLFDIKKFEAAQKLLSIKD